MRLLDKFLHLSCPLQNNLDLPLESESPRRLNRTCEAPRQPAGPRRKRIPIPALRGLAGSEPQQSANYLSPPTQIHEVEATAPREDGRRPSVLVRISGAMMHGPGAHLGPEPAKSLKKTISIRIQFRTLLQQIRDCVPRSMTASLPASRSFFAGDNPQTSSFIHRPRVR